MLKSFLKSCPAPEVPFSLSFSLKNFQSRVKTHRDKIKYYESHPQFFQKYSKMKPPDLTKKDLVFPINIPIRYRYRFKRAKRVEIPANDVINFKLMTGNEVLLYLERCTELRSSELCGALIELTKRPGNEKIDWNTHEFVANCKEYVIPKLPQYREKVVHQLILAFSRLKMFDPILWSGLHKESNKHLHLLKPKMFGKLYKIYHEENTKAPKEMLDRMTTMMPNIIGKMSPDDIVNIFEIVLKNNYLNYHLFEDIFYIMFRNRNKWFGPQNYVRIIKMFVDLKHLNDNDFWNKRFLPPMLTWEDELNEMTIPPLAESLKQLNELAGDKIPVEPYLKFFEERTTFLKTKIRATENNKLFNIILNDLKYFKEKEMDRVARK